MTEQTEKLFIKLAEPVDRMPVEVATSLLLEPKAKLTNRMRKNCMMARTTVYESTLRPKPIEVKLANKFKPATFAQLQKWLRRAKARRMVVQRAYEKADKLRLELTAKPVDPKDEAGLTLVQSKLLLLDRVIAGLLLKAEQLDMVWDAVASQISDRKR